MVNPETKEQWGREIWNWQHGGTSFRSQIFSLFSKADEGNQVRLSLGFPQEYKIWLQWYLSDNETHFYVSCGLNPETGEVWQQSTGS